MLYVHAKKEIKRILKSNLKIQEKRQEICNFLKGQVEHYHWVGFYFRNGDKDELKLAEFSGEPTVHTIIPFGKGICGQVAVSNKNFVVPDVSEQDNYISCGVNVKSEIVIPIFVKGQNIGQLDIDSHNLDPFTENDVSLIESICQKIGDEMD
jgi:GAF domain-containing protein